MSFVDHPSYRRLLVPPLTTGVKGVQSSVVVLNQMLYTPPPPKRPWAAFLAVFSSESSCQTLKILLL